MNSKRELTLSCGASLFALRHSKNIDGAELVCFTFASTDGATGFELMMNATDLFEKVKNQPDSNSINHLFKSYIYNKWDSRRRYFKTCFDGVSLFWLSI